MADANTSFDPLAAYRRGGFRYPGFRSVGVDTTGSTGPAAGGGSSTTTPSATVAANAFRGSSYQDGGSNESGNSQSNAQGDPDAIGGFGTIGGVLGAFTGVPGLGFAGTAIDGIRDYNDAVSQFPNQEDDISIPESIMDTFFDPFDVFGFKSSEEQARDAFTKDIADRMDEANEATGDKGDPGIGPGQAPSGPAEGPGGVADPSGPGNPAGNDPGGPSGDPAGNAGQTGGQAGHASAPGPAGDGTRGDPSGDAPGGDGPGGDGPSGGPGGGEGVGCFVAGTLVTVPEGHKAIETVEPGDWVMAFDGLGALEPKRVVNTKSHERRAVLTLVLPNTTIQCTPEHPFLRPDGTWSTAGKLMAGDAIVPEAGGSVIILATLPAAGSVTVYNFEVEDHHTYCVEGVRVHNWKHEGGLITDGDPMTDGVDVEQTYQEGEYVIPRDLTNQIGVQNLELVRRGMVPVAVLTEAISTYLQTNGVQGPQSVPPDAMAGAGMRQGRVPGAGGMPPRPMMPQQAGPQGQGVPPIAMAQAGLRNRMGAMR